MNFMRMPLSRIFLFLMMICTCQMITMDEVQKMKDDLDKELKAMEIQASLKKDGNNDPKSKSADPANEEVLSDLIKHDIKYSLKQLTNGRGVSSKNGEDKFFQEVIKAEQQGKTKSTEKSATDFIKKLIEEEKSGQFDAENLILDKLISKHNKANVEVEKREKAFEALEKLQMKEFEKKESKDADVVRMHGNEAESKFKDNLCNDVRPDCENLAHYCKTKAYRQILKKKCAFTCKFCYRCRDVLAHKLCMSLAKQCKVPMFAARMKDYCYDTCGYCKWKSPPACQNSPFGCCWNNVTNKNDKKGLNCPTCANKYEALCKNFIDECPKQNRPGKFMRENCPKSCGLCRGCAEKVDKPGFEELCLKWKKEGYCKVLDVGDEYCAHTCQCKT